MTIVKEDKLKESIISKSIELFSSAGVKVVTMEDIAKALSISKKTIYNFFTKKEDIIKYSFDIMIDNVTREIQDIYDKELVTILEIRELHEIYVYYLTEMNSPNVLQTKKYYSGIYKHVEDSFYEILSGSLKKNITKGINENIYRVNILDNDDTVFIYYYSLKELVSNLKINRKAKEKLLMTFIFYFCRSIASYKGLSMISSEEKRLDF